METTKNISNNSETLSLSVQNKRRTKTKIKIQCYLDGNLENRYRKLPDTRYITNFRLTINAKCKPIVETYCIIFR